MSKIQRRSARQGGKRGNVMTPLNWMCGVSETVLLPTAASNNDNWLGSACFFLALGIVCFYGTMYLFYSLVDRDRLQTEEYNLDAQEMRIHFISSEEIKLSEDSKQILIDSAPVKK